ncbi:DEAD/DEAH box helicase [Bacillus massiliglaciei]|uniref:DEAD/DEAH box helicase n=1 Tax=Bacillus massiliglaciei TaxID=1816693 RepID=UPI000DA61260|nr:DEAD/DEAH box helicase [Bacillus massiliglaciei]
MNIHIDRKTIKDMCGLAALKRGDAYFRAGQVTLKDVSQEQCVFSVQGTEEFTVLIEPGGQEGFSAECSCPQLMSFSKSCQHIAAALLYLEEWRKRRDESDEENLAEGFIELFKNHPARPSAAQMHFEDRETIQAAFICKPVLTEHSRPMLGISLEIASSPIRKIHSFLQDLEKGQPIKVSERFTFDPSVHCFQRESDDVMKQLCRAAKDERLYQTGYQDASALSREDILIIPPTAWEEMALLLPKVQSVKFNHDSVRYEGIKFTDKRLPLHFWFEENGQSRYQLRITGIRNVFVLDAYHSVFYEGEMFRLTSDDCRRLSELQHMLKTTGTDRIPVSSDQVTLFLDKVVPGLRKLGDVRISEKVNNRFHHTPLEAKLFLDRVHNRLLAGLEFHYGHLVINPLDRTSEVPLLLREEEKEKAILELMEESSFAQTDGGYVLQNEELEYEFLYHLVPKLQKLLQVHATLAVRNRIFRKNARPKIRVKVNKERTNWLEFTFEMKGIPDEEIKEILLAMEEKRKYYRLKNGSLFSLETRELDEINRFLKELPVQDDDLENSWHVPLIAGIPLLGAVQDPNTFAMEESFRALLDKLHHPERLEYQIPDAISPLLRHYQATGYKWMKMLSECGFGGILADEMGLGKTLQSIAFVTSELSEIREAKQPVLIVCPSSLTYNWFNEIIKFSPEIKAEVIDGEKKEREEKIAEMSELDAVIISYPLLRKDIDLMKKNQYHAVFLDEAQAFKNPATQTAKAVKKIQAGSRFALTGTPIENSLEELWSIFYVVFPELFKGLKEFSHLSKKQVARRVRPFMLRRVKQDVLSELPSKKEITAFSDLLPEQKRLYTAYLAKLRHDTLKHLDKDTLRKNRIRILAGLTRLRQICCHPVLFIDQYEGQSAKFQQLKQLIGESMASGRRVLIFSQFTSMLKLIGNTLSRERIPYFYLDGQTPSEERVDLSNRFNGGEREVFLISLKAGGTGLNMTGADTVIFYDNWWNPAIEEQAAGRAHRFGQKKEVQVIKLIARGTIEEKMSELQEKKRDLIKEVIDQDDKELLKLTDDDIRDLLQL